MRLVTYVVCEALFFSVFVVYMSTIVKPLPKFFCRIGSKSSLKDKIIPKIPDSKIYVEPFVGGGAVFFGRRTKAEKEVLNDKDTELMSAYRFLKNRNSLPKLTLPEGLSQLNSFVETKSRSPNDSFLKYIIRSCGTFGSKGSGQIYRDVNLKKKLDKIPVFHERLKDVTLLSQDYQSVMTKYDSPDTFFYLDPPYEKSEDLYKNVIDLETLAKICKNMKGNFILSINDSPAIRRLFKDSKFKRNFVIVKGPHNNNIGEKDRREILIRNF